MLVRIQGNILAKPERYVLTRLCRIVPGAIKPDHMTVLGLTGAGIVFVMCLLSRMSPYFLWGTIVGLGVHWLGDSMDGSLARFRHCERPRYGYFVDHAVDALGNFFIMAGMGLTLYIRTDVAMLTIAGYFLISIFVFLKRQAVDEFQLSFLAMGPTELRLILVIMTLLMLMFGGPGLRIAGEFFTVYDMFLCAGSLVFVVLFVVGVTGTSARLRREEPGPH